MSQIANKLLKEGVDVQKYITPNKTPYQIGEKVRIKKDLRDAYSEVWHTAGSELRVAYFSKDGEGVMFDCDLGLHYSNVEPI